jgi:ABC-type lipoprotein release transport system permease subunit
VRRLTWSQLRFGPARALALLAGMLVAVTAFTVLTAASRTSQLRTIGTVTAHFRTAYDILVRPQGSKTELESRTGTVQPNFLSGIYGGITMAQYREIQQIPGVQVAAPIAMVGYLMPSVPLTFALPAAAATGHGRQLYRVTTTWVSAGGSIRIPQPPSYVYITSNPLVAHGAYEQLPGGSKAPVCSGYALATGHPPFSAAAQSSLWCASRVTGMFGDGSWEALNARRPGFAVRWSFPMLVAAIDPAAEAKLDRLNRAVVSGRYLSENDGVSFEGAPGGESTFPVLAADNSGVGEYVAVRVQRLPNPGSPPVLDPAQMRADDAVAGRTVDKFTITAGHAYHQLLSLLTGTAYQEYDDSPNAYWNVGPTTYRRGRGGDLVAVAVRNPESIWSLSVPGLRGPPMDEAAIAYRAIREHENTNQSQVQAVPVPAAVGEFGPGKVRAFDPLSQVPLGPFQPTAAAPANSASRRALGGHDLLPSLNLGGYVSQPVQLITTLSDLPFIENSAVFTGDLHTADPISVIRVRVAGVTGPNPLSLARIKEVAQLIAVRTHLAVDVVTGSSPAPVTVSLPAGAFGQPSLLLTEDWVKKGAAVAILSAVDTKSVVLFTLILVVCALFVANSATAAVRGRRQELGVLACLGWTRPRIYATVLGELALLGLAAGVAGGALSLPLSAGLGLRFSAGRALLAIPAAVSLAVVAGGVPAWLASRADPVAAVRPPVLDAGQARHLRGVTGLAVVNVLRTPGRSLVGALSLAVGVAALTMLTAVTLAFRGAIVGSLLGNVVAVQVRSVDYVAVAATVVLGVLAVADVLFLNIRERAAELAAIRAFGWPESALGRLVVTEGAVIGLCGSLAGTAAGLAAAAEFSGQFPARLLLAAAGAVLAGVLVTAAAALLPAQLLRRLPTAQLLAEE